jgi:hypothetical protein
MTPSAALATIQPALPAPNARLPPGSGRVLRPDPRGSRTDPFRSATEIERRYRSRYIPSQQFYFDTARPTDHADIIVHNDKPRRPA